MSLRVWAFFILLKNKSATHYITKYWWGTFGHLSVGWISRERGSSSKTSTWRRQVLFFLRYWKPRFSHLCPSQMSCIFPLNKWQSWVFLNHFANLVAFWVIDTVLQLCTHLLFVGKERNCRIYLESKCWMRSFKCHTGNQVPCDIFF